MVVSKCDEGIISHCGRDASIGSTLLWEAAKPPTMRTVNGMGGIVMWKTSYVYNDAGQVMSERVHSYVGQLRQKSKQRWQLRCEDVLGN